MQARPCCYLARFFPDQTVIKNILFVCTCKTLLLSDRVLAQNLISLDFNLQTLLSSGRILAKNLTRLTWKYLTSRRARPIILQHFRIVDQNLARWTWYLTSVHTICYYLTEFLTIVLSNHILDDCSCDILSKHGNSCEIMSYVFDTVQAEAQTGWSLLPYS